jgi:hypothetical protein
VIPDTQYYARIGRIVVAMINGRARFVPFRAEVY